MTLRVIRYKNYGCTMTGPDDSKSDWENNFYWSFYELSNGNIINLHYTQNLKKNKFIDDEFDFYYTNYELNNGKKISYKFGDAKGHDLNSMSKEFFQWFESKPPYHQIKDPKYPTKDEEKCIKDFFLKHVEINKKTNTIYLNN